jgi:hypothetical protein
LTERADVLPWLFGMWRSRIWGSWPRSSRSLAGEPPIAMCQSKISAIQRSHLPPCERPADVGDMSRVFAGPHREIGWGRVTLTDEGSASCLAPLADPDAVALHWHGDTFDLPEGAARLASSDLYYKQAFAFGQQARGAAVRPNSPRLAFPSPTCGPQRPSLRTDRGRRRNRYLPHGCARSFSSSIARPQPAPDRRDRRQGTAAPGRRSLAGRGRRCTGGPDGGS